jgi:hypothetical protein
MKEEFSEHEELLLKSWDTSVTAQERETLAAAMQNNPVIRSQSGQYQHLRTLLLRQQPDSFGPFFAERVMYMIKQRTQQIDYLIFFFFKKYQVVLLGVLVALFISNILLTDQLSVKGIFGLEQEAAEEVFGIDIYKDLTK